ncbi:CCA tRNA nucleotidyltransferase [Carnobacterium gallinarum]|uniref:CCA tRNA nucleotidyltransferase n=1 Tax=Carnobacterium gallinarum TaxID=2749 RepID=UPI0009FEB8D7|nr:CCA tRNA nucleotidyltransferase [Carnobacterium gallinarum]
MQLVPEFITALPVLKKIEEAGFEAYFVGGSVRDLILQKPISDVDIATSAFPAEIKAIFPKTIDVGIDHGTVMALWQKESYEITTFRTESTYQDYRRPDEVVFVRSLKEDLKRRDFTVNALAMDADGKIIDYFDGLQDIQNRVLKAVGSPTERFHEDALRMMRGVRFVSQLDFELETTTEEAILEHHALLEKIAVERVQVEFIKLLLGRGRSRGLEKMIQTELYLYCPGLRHSGEGLYRFASLEGQLVDRLTAWTLLVYFIQLENENIDSFMRQWKCSKKEIQEVQLAKSALDERLFGTWTVDCLYRTGIEIAVTVETIVGMLTEKNDVSRLKAMFQQLPIKHKKELDITGNELIAALDCPPGIWLGALLTKIEGAVLHGELKNDKQTILSWARSQKK